VSLRGPDALAIIGQHSKAVVWSMVGPFLRQHDPDIFGDGTLLVFDNRTEIKQPTPVRWLEEPPVWGFSRLLRLDPATQQVLWSFEGSRRFPFYSSIQGKEQILANGNILVSDPEGGRAFEISPAHGNRVVWEYVNMIDGDGPGFLGRVTEATRYDFEGARFLNVPCP
ncbi:MAG TPA: arylsulfotransferase family protein, partial [Longimicrobiales bacterium]|nr:arylsulfotransferase family protein [Longimicrobiales bacterium]